MCRYEVPVVQWLFCGHAHAYPPVKKHPSYPAPPPRPRPGQPSTSSTSSGASQCDECSQGLLSQYYARPMFVEAWCAGCAWAAYAYHPLYAVPPEVSFYMLTISSAAIGALIVLDVVWMCSRCMGLQTHPRSGAFSVRARPLRTA